MEEVTEIQQLTNLIKELRSGNQQIESIEIVWEKFDMTSNMYTNVTNYNVVRPKIVIKYQ